MVFKLSWKVNVILNLAAFIVAIFLRAQIYDAVLKFYTNAPLILDFNFLFFPYCIVLIVVTCAFHELFHGIVYKMYGGKVKYGFKLMLLCPYTQEISGMQLGRNKFVTVLLAPLVLVSLLCLVLPLWIRYIVFFINFIGCSGDIYMAAIVLVKLKKTCKIVDRPYGFDVIDDISTIDNTSL